MKTAGELIGENLNVVRPKRDKQLGTCDGIINAEARLWATDRGRGPGLSAFSGPNPPAASHWQLHPRAKLGSSAESGSLASRVATVKHWQPCESRLRCCVCRQNTFRELAPFQTYNLTFLFLFPSPKSATTKSFNTRWDSSSSSRRLTTSSVRGPSRRSTGSTHLGRVNTIWLVGLF